MALHGLETENALIVDADLDSSVPPADTTKSSEYPADADGIVRLPSAPSEVKPVQVPA